MRMHTSLAMWCVPFRTLLALIVNVLVPWAWTNEMRKTLRAHWVHMGEERQYQLCKFCNIRWFKVAPVIDNFEKLS